MNHPNHDYDHQEYEFEPFVDTIREFFEFINIKSTFEANFRRQMILCFHF